MALQGNKHLIKRIFILLLPVAFFAGVKFLIYLDMKSICIWEILTGHDCPGCGITRAFNALFSGQFMEAYRYNPKIVIVAPLMIFVWPPPC